MLILNPFPNSVLVMLQRYPILTHLRMIRLSTTMMLKRYEILSFILCAIGGCWQLIFISEQYFEYGINSLVLFSRIVVIPYPIVAICSMANDQSIYDQPMTLTDIDLNTTPIKNFFFMNGTKPSIGTPVGPGGSFFNINTRLMACLTTRMTTTVPMAT